METSNAPTSFIPHDTAMSAPRRFAPGAGGGLNDLFLLLAVVLVFASGALAGGVFLYQQYLQTSSVSKVQQLQRAQAAFEPALIEQITRLDDRMHVANTILSNHLAPSAFFDALGKTTLVTIAYEGMNLDFSDPQHIKMTTQGVAQSVNSVAAQAQVLSKSGVIKNPIFSGVQREQDGVHFSLTAEVNPAAMNYEHIVSAGGAIGADTLPVGNGQDTTPSSASQSTPSATAPTSPPSSVPANTASTTPNTSGL